MQLNKTADARQSRKPSTPLANNEPSRAVPGEPTTPPCTRGQQAARVLVATPIPLSQPSSASHRHSSPVQVSIGQAKARAPRKTLFEGNPPLVERKAASGGGARFKFTQTTPLEQLRQPIAAACHELFAQAQTLDDAIAFLDAVCRQPGDAEVWHEMLRCHGEALSRSRRLLPSDVLSWVKRLRQMAQADLGGLNGPGARQALHWAQALVEGFSGDVSGAAARACALVNQWTRESRGAGARPLPATPLTPSPSDTQPTVPSTDGSRTSDPTPPRMTHRSWYPARHPMPALDRGQESPIPTPTPRGARQARSSLPLFRHGGAVAEQTAPYNDSPLGRALHTAEQGGGIQPLIEALGQWPGSGPVLASAPEDEGTGSGDDTEAFGHQALRRVLTVCETYELDTAQRAELLRVAHALLGPAWTADALLRSDYANALHRWLEPDEAAHLLLADGLPPGQLPVGHPYQERLTVVQTLVDWGLPEAAAQRLPSRGAYAWAHRTLFEGPFPLVQGEGSGPERRFQGQPGHFDDVQVDAVLTVCQAWRDAQRPDLALALMTATRDQALTNDRDTALLRRWEAMVVALKRQTAALESAPAVPLPRILTKTFAPWLTVSLTINPANALTTDAGCVAMADLAANAKPAARQLALGKLVLWLESELRDPNGLSWPLLVKLLQTVETQLGSDLALTSTQWLKMALMEFERSGNAEPLPPLLSSLSRQQERMKQEGHAQPLLDEALLDKVFLMAKHPALDAASRGNLIQNALPLLPKRNGPGAASHATCLLALLAQDDLLIRGTLFDAYLMRHPFASLSDLTPRLFRLAAQLDRPESLRSAETWNKFASLPRPGRKTAWPLWRALCRELARRIAPRVLEVQQPTQAPQDQREFNEQILWTLNRLSEHKNQAGLSAEHQAELLADLTEAMPQAHRRAFLEQLDAACLALIERSLAGSLGARGAPVPSWPIALRGALQALIDQLGNGTPRVPAPCSSPALNASTQFLREWFTARLAGRLGGAPYRGPDLETLKLLHEINTYSPRRLLLSASASPMETLIEELFALRKQK